MSKYGGGYSYGRRGGCGCLFPTLLVLAGIFYGLYYDYTHYREGVWDRAIKPKIAPIVRVIESYESPAESFQKYIGVRVERCFSDPECIKKVSEEVSTTAGEIRSGTNPDVRKALDDFLRPLIEALGGH
ncbi:MAG: hypothetical protein QXY45_04510 [Candidatus Aenigmatarchaeota archaeon]